MIDLTPKQIQEIAAKVKIVLPTMQTQMGDQISGWEIGSDELSSGKVRIQATAQRILIGDAVEPLSGIGIFIGLDGSDYEWRVGDPSGEYIHWTGTKLNVKASISASSLDIPDGLTANSFHVDTLGNTHWGSILIANATAKILNTGAATFSNITITGGYIGGMPVSNVGYVSNPTSDAVPTGLTCSSTGIATAIDGTQSAYVVLTWTAISTDTFDHYVIRFKKASYTYYTYISSSTNTITIDGLVPNVSYNFGIASVNKYGTQSAFSADISQTTASDTTAPAKVAGLSALAGIQISILTWTSNSETDLAYYNVYRNTTNNSGTAVLIASVRANNFTDSGRTGGTALYYWIKAVDTSANESSAFSDSSTCTPRNVASADANIAQIGWTQTCAFTSTDTDTVSWGAGTFTSANGTIYNISAGNTGNMGARTYIYLDIAVSTTAYQITTTNTNAVGDGKVLIAVAENNTTEATFMVLNTASAVWDGSSIVAGSITGNEIAANTIVAGNIQAGTITATEIDTDTITSLDYLLIGAPQVVLQGAITISSWLGDDGEGNMTFIDGGHITANTITTSHLDFTPVESNSIIASINASAEGITIDADNITISGSTTFAAGYDPSAALATAQDKAQVFTSEPTTPYYVGDLWADGSVLKKCKSEQLVGAYDANDWELATGYTDDTVANSKIKTFIQDAIPTSVSAGDFWIDSDGGNALYRAEIAGADEIKAGEWVAVPDNNKLGGAGSSAVGGSYASAASGARICIFPDVNTGLQIIDDIGNDVLKVIVGGTYVGDVYIGNYAGGQGIFFDKSANTTTFSGAVTSSVITGGTFQTAASGERIVMDGTTSANYIDFYNSSNERTGYLYNTVSSDVNQMFLASELDKDFLTDGSFEIWTTSTNLTSWTEDGVSAGVRDIEREAVEVDDGDYSVKLTATASDGTTDFGLYQDYANFPAGEYDLSVRLKYSTRTQGTCRIEAYNQTDGVSLATTENSTTGSWQTLRIRNFTITASSKTVRFKVYLENETSGTLYVDGFSCTRLSSTIKLDNNYIGIKSGHNDYWAGFKVAEDMARNIIWTLPEEDGDPGQALTTDGNGNLSFDAGEVTFYGDGSDGDVTVTAETPVTLTSDMYYNSLNIQFGAYLYSAGYRIFVKGILNNGGTISAKGGNGGNGSGATGGIAGTATVAGSMQGGVAGVAGSNGKTTSQQYGTQGITGIDIVKGLGSNGVVGGAGGDANGSLGGYQGGDGGLAGSLSGTIYNIPRTFISAYQLYDIYPSSTIAPLYSTAGSGSGGSGAISNITGTGYSGAGGGSGAAGGILFISAKNIVNGGTITAQGGNGGNGSNAGGTATPCCMGGGGGGSGGNGGIIFLKYSSFTDDGGTITVAGGTGGTGGTKLIRDTEAAVAEDGFSGNSGNEGKIIYL